MRINKMSCTVLWKPIINDGKYVGKGIFRDILNKKYGFPSKLNHSDIPYLEGLLDGGYYDAQTLIEAILHEDEIEIFLEC
jgi:hypothetical protein